MTESRSIIPSSLHAPIPGVPAALERGVVVLRAVVSSLATHFLGSRGSDPSRLYVSILADATGYATHEAACIEGIVGAVAGVPPASARHASSSTGAPGAQRDAAPPVWGDRLWVRCRWPGEVAPSRWLVHVDVILGPSRAIGYALLVVAHGGGPRPRVYDVERTVVRWELGTA